MVILSHCRQHECCDCSINCAKVGCVICTVAVQANCEMPAKIPASELMEGLTESSGFLPAPPFQHMQLLHRHTRFKHANGGLMEESAFILNNVQEYRTERCSHCMWVTGIYMVRPPGP